MRTTYLYIWVTNMSTHILLVLKFPVATFCIILICRLSMCAPVPYAVSLITFQTTNTSSRSREGYQAYSWV
ncbi:hypothetical protein F4802DRAFT_560680 [Xylaria palmicola]|nr:hypothetical protein F4802DRAFT_560680 [Xylaria palmicola]